LDTADAVLDIGFVSIANYSGEKIFLWHRLDFKVEENFYP